MIWQIPSKSIFFFQYKHRAGVCSVVCFSVKNKEWVFSEIFLKTTTPERHSRSFIKFYYFCMYACGFAFTWATSLIAPFKSENTVISR